MCDILFQCLLFVVRDLHVSDSRCHQQLLQVCLSIRYDKHTCRPLTHLLTLACCTLTHTHRYANTPLDTPLTHLLTLACCTRTHTHRYANTPLDTPLIHLLTLACCTLTHTHIVRQFCIDHLFSNGNQTDLRLVHIQKEINFIT